MDFYQRLADRLNISIKMPDTGSKKLAAETLNTALNNNKAAVAWVDRASMPYLQLPEAMIAHIGHIVSICGQDGSDYLVDDLAAQPYRVDAEVLATARARISSYKSRLLLMEYIPPSFDLPQAIREGLQDQIEHLSSTSESFGLPAIRKWAKTMTDSKNKKGWPKVFEDRRGLMSTLVSLFDAIELGGAPGGLRSLYADFLTEAGPIIGNSRLSEPVEHYRKLAAQWSHLAEAALSDDVPLFRETKHLLRQRDRLVKQGGEVWRESATLTAQIAEKRREGNLNFPLKDAEVMDYFATLQAHLKTIYTAEEAALNALKSAVA